MADNTKDKETKIVETWGIGEGRKPFNPDPENPQHFFTNQYEVEVNDEDKRKRQFVSDRIL